MPEATTLGSIDTNDTKKQIMGNVIIKTNAQSMPKQRNTLNN